MKEYKIPKQKRIDLNDGTYIVFDHDPNSDTLDIKLYKPGDDGGAEKEVEVEYCCDECNNIGYAWESVTVEVECDGIDEDIYLKATDFVRDLGLDNLK